MGAVGFGINTYLQVLMWERFLERGALTLRDDRARRDWY